MSHNYKIQSLDGLFVIIVLPEADVCSIPSWHNDFFEALV